MHEARHAEILGVDNLISARGIEDGLGVDAGFVMEGRVAGNVIIERDIDLDS
jgi:hypothetical protein